MSPLARLAALACLLGAAHAAHAAQPAPPPAPSAAPASAPAPASALTSSPHPAPASPDATPITVRVGDHRGYGRVVYDLPEATPSSFRTEPGRIVIEVPGASSLPAPDRLPRNVRAVHVTDGVVELDLAPGAQARAARIGDRVVVDVLSPRRTLPSPAAQVRPGVVPPPVAPTVPAKDPTVAQPASDPVAPPASAPALPPPSAPVVAKQVPPPAPAAPAPAPAVAQPVSPAPRAVVEQTPLDAPMLAAPVDTGPISVAAVPLPAGEAGAVLPFPRTVGAAALERGDRALLVFDVRQPLDLAQLADDPVLGAAKVELLPAATLVSFPIAPGNALGLERVPEGWRVRLGASVSPPAPAVRQEEGSIVFGVANAAQVVVVPDPEGEGTLLVGTVRPASGTGMAVAVARRTPSFRILPAWLGLAVETLSDRVQLTTRTEGFALQVPAPLLAPEALMAETAAGAASLTRAFDFPDQPAAALLRRMDGAVAAAAEAPARGRLPARLAAAQAMISLGLGVEAEGLVATARAEEPGSAQDAHAAALQAVAAVLDGRLGHAGALNDPRVSGTDEITLWRAAAAASQAALKGERSPSAAAAFAATAPLILAYPKALRDKLLPLAAETMVLGGQERAADALLSRRPDDSTLSLARALRFEAAGETDKALALYDGLAAGRDRLVRLRASVRAIEVRHAAGQMDAAAAADALDHLLIVWRGDQRELSLRLRMAELRVEAGQFRPALELLRDTQALFPAASESIKARMSGVFETLLSDGHADALKPLDFIALAGEFAGSVPGGDAGDRLAAQLAKRLVALDLPDQAAPVLERLMRAAPEGPARARFGVQLAAMRVDGGDPAAALAALSASEAPGLPPDLGEERGLLLARVQAGRGDLPGATATLAALGTAAADEARASLLENAKDWPGAQAALRDLAAKRLGATGPFSPEQQEIVLREASAALQAGDRDALGALRQADGARMGTGPRADLFHLLTDRPVQSSSDLSRSAQDVALARDLPAGLQSLSAR